MTKEEIQKNSEHWYEKYEELVDIMALVSKNDLQKENEQLKEKIEKMKCCYNCSKWNDGQCADVPNDNSYYSADFVCDKWELKND